MPFGLFGYDEYDLEPMGAISTTKPPPSQDYAICIDKTYDTVLNGFTKPCVGHGGVYNYYYASTQSSNPPMIVTKAIPENTPTPPSNPTPVTMCIRAPCPQNENAQQPQPPCAPTYNVGNCNYTLNPSTLPYR